MNDTDRRVISERGRRNAGWIVGTLWVVWLGAVTIDTAGSRRDEVAGAPLVLAVFAGIATIVGAWLLLWRCVRMGIVFDGGETFAVRGLLRTRTVRWVDVDRFEVDRLRLGPGHPVRWFEGASRSHHVDDSLRPRRQEGAGPARGTRRRAQTAARPARLPAPDGAAGGGHPRATVARGAVGIGLGGLQIKQELES